MPKVPLSTITSGYGTVDALNQNFDAIEAAFDNTLSRNGDTPNQMQANLDMNGFNVLNQGNPIVVDGLNWRGNWATATAYALGDIVQTNGIAYICIVAHTSGVFATDLAAVRWQVFVQTNLPTQTGNSGKFLTTNGTSASWDAIKYTPLGTGAVQRTIASKVQEYVSVKDFGAVGDGVTDDTAAIQACLDYCLTSLKTCFLPVGYYAVRESSPGSGFALRNRGVSMIGEGTFYSQIVPLSSMPNTADFLRVTPNDGGYIDFLEFGRFSIHPAYDGTKRGRHGIYLYTPQATNLSRWYVHDLYLLPGNDYSLKVENNNVINFQGVPANSVIERNMFWEGMFLNKIGDSITIRNNVFRGSSGTNRAGIYLYISDTSGVASHAMIVENNFDCPGGAVIVQRGRNVKVNYNNIELSEGTGSGSGAIIDIDGASGAIPWAEVTGNHLGTFGTANPDSMIRVNAGVGVTVDKNTILTAFNTRAAIFITNSANNTDVGFNEIGTTFITPVDDQGDKTIGTLRAITPVGGWSNTGGSYETLKYFKSRDGIVTLKGVLNAPANPNGVGLGTLPLGYRPDKIVRSVVGAVVSGNISSGAVEVSSSGNITFFGSNSTTRIEICMVFSTPNYVRDDL